MTVALLVGQPQDGESNKAILACNDYLRMGPGRSLRRLEDRYREGSQQIAPTTSIGTLTRWSQDFSWQARAEIFDKENDEEKTRIIAARRRAIMEDGLALDYERVNELYELFDKLKLEFVKNGLWYTDTKLSAKGDTVDVEVFNKPLIDSLRGVLDDLAKENGGRKQKTEISGANGGPIVGAITSLDEWNAQQDKARKQAQQLLDGTNVQDETR